jgi:type IV secretory pathway VirB10-like protein
MDTLKILLGATVALLLGALGVSLYHQKAPGKEADSLEKAELMRQIEELRLEQDRLQIEKQRLALQEAAAQAPPVAQPPPPAAEVAAMQEQIAQLQAEKDKAERDAETADREAAFVGGKMLESRDKEARRARLIGQALLIARVKEWVESPEVGGFATLEVLMPENVQPGTVLCLRRNTGILGRLRVDDVSIEGAIANPVSAFTETRPQAGDELILEPPF